MVGFAAGAIKEGRWCSVLASGLVAARKDRLLDLVVQFAFLCREGDPKRSAVQESLVQSSKPALGAEPEASSLGLQSKEIEIDQYCLNTNEFRKYLSELSD